ncbi:MAG: site-specific integrase [Rhodomicrobium sp.]
MAKLTVKAVEAAKPGSARREIPDGLIGGLYLVVQPVSGAKSWAYRYRFNGKTRKLTLGRYPKIGLVGARELAQKAELQIRQDRDPALKTPRREEKTVEALARDFIQVYCHIHNRPRTWRERARLLGLEPDPYNHGKLRLTKSKGEVLSKWQGRSIQSITGEDVIDLTDAIVARGTKVHANRVLSVIRAMFAWAVSRKLLAASPCAGIRAPAKERPRQRVLQPHELRAVWRAAERLGGPAGAAYKLLILSGQRKSQATLARIEDFDLKERLWTIPAEQEGSKKAVPHVLPITAEIEAIVEACPHRRGYLFSTTMGAKPLTLGAKLKKQMDALVLEELRKEAAGRGDDPVGVKLAPWTNHDMRRTMRTGLSALAVPEGDLIRELVIGHVRPGVSGIYDTHRYLPEKKIALELWADRVRDIAGQGRAAQGEGERLIHAR